MRRLIALGLALAAFAAPAAAQSPQTPDFSGSWERYPPAGETADARYAPTPPTNPPLKQPWLAQWQENEAKLAARIAESHPPGDNYIKCLPDGMPAMMQGMFPMEIFQRPEQINITQEAFNQTRRIPMGGTLPRWDEVDPTFFGTSVGHWEGDTLVIETTGIKQHVTFRWVPHSEAMKITAQDLQSLGVVDRIVPEPLGGAHRDPEAAIVNLREAVVEELSGCGELSGEDLLRQRRAKYLAIG